MREQHSALDARDDMLELADRYETVVALDVVVDVGPGVRTVPGSRLPPGMQEVLDQDEIAQAVDAVDDWAEFLAHVVVDECDVTVPSGTTHRLRAVAQHAGHFVDHEDELFGLSVLDDLYEHLRTMRRLATRGVRRVRTGTRCQHGGCSGWLVSPLGAAQTEQERSEAALVCDRDARHQVPFVVWSRWPRQRVRFITVEHAARMLGTSVAAAKMRASRGKWGRIGTGRDVRYDVDDVRASAGLDGDGVSSA